MTLNSAVEEFAACMKCHPRTIRRLIAAGRLPAKNLALGGHAELRIDEQEAVRPSDRRDHHLTHRPAAGPAGPSVAAAFAPLGGRVPPVSSDARSPRRWS